MPEKKRKTNWLWPKIVDIETSRSAANVGFWAAIFVCISTTIVTTVALGAKEINEILHLDAWAYLDAALFGVIAWRVKRFSRAFAVLGVALYVLEITYTLNQGAKIGWMTIPILLMFISGARGVFGYHRFVAALDQNTREPNDPAGPVVSAMQMNPAPAGSTSADQRLIGPQSPAAAASATPRSPSTTSGSMSEKVIYAKIADELDSGNLDRSTWTMAFAEADGDTSKARARYIRYRVAELQQSREMTSSTQEQSEQGETTAFENAESPTHQTTQTPQSAATTQTPTEWAQSTHDLGFGGAASPSQSVPARGSPGVEKVAESAVAAPTGLLVVVAFVVVAFAGGLLLLANGANHDKQVTTKIPNTSAESASTRQPASTAAAPQAEQALIDANRGDATAQINLAHMYYKGDGVAQDYTEAVKWYRKAADQGNADAQTTSDLCTSGAMA